MSGTRFGPEGPPVTITGGPYPRGPLGPNPDNDKVVLADDKPQTAKQRNDDLHEAVTAVTRRSHIERVKRALAAARMHAERASPGQRDEHARRVELLESELRALGEP